MEEKDLAKYFDHFFGKTLAEYPQDGSLLHLPLQSVPRYTQEEEDFESSMRPLWYLALLPEQYPRTMQSVFKMLRKGVYGWSALKNNDQRIAELPALLFFLWKNQEEWKKNSSKEERQALMDWVCGYRTCRHADNNWNLFGVLIERFLISMGFDGDKNLETKLLERTLEFLCDKEEGHWFRDGAGGAVDHYNGFAFHFYLLLWLEVGGGEIEDALKQKLEAISLSFAEDYALLFDSNGRAVAYGRSMNYKMALLAFWSMYIVHFRHSRISKGVSITVAARILKRGLIWWEKQEILDENGLLVPGFAYRNAAVTEIYTASGSALWAAKVSLILMIDKKDSFWQEEWSCRKEEIKEDTESRFISRCPKGSGLILQKGEGQALLYPDGAQPPMELGANAAKYGRYVYSSLHGFCAGMGGSQEEAAPESISALQVGDSWLMRPAIKGIANEREIRSIWQPLPGIKIRTRLLIEEGYHIRIHEIISRVNMTFYDYGFALPQEQSDGRKGKYYICLEGQNGEERIFSAARSIQGHSIAKEIKHRPGSNLLYKKTSAPCLVCDLKAGNYRIINAFRGGSQSCPDWDPHIPENLKKTSAREAGNRGLRMVYEMKRLKKLLQ